MVNGLAGRGISKTQFPLWVSFPLLRWGVGEGEGDLQLDLEVKGGSEIRRHTYQEWAGGGDSAVDQVVCRYEKVIYNDGKAQV